MKSVKFIFIFIIGILSAEAQDLIPYNYNKKWGYLNQSKNILIKAVYDSASVFQHNLAIVEENNKYGVIGIDGSKILKSEFDEIKIIDDKQIQTIKNSSKIFYNNSGKRINTIYHNLNCRLRIKSREFTPPLEFPFLKRKNKYALLFLNEKTNEIDTTEFNYNTLSPFGVRCYRVEKNSKQAIFDPCKHYKEKDLEFVMDSISNYRPSYSDLYESNLLIYFANDKQGLMNDEGDIILKATSPKIEYTQDANLYLIKTEDQNYYYINSKGISFEYIDSQ